MIHLQSYVSSVNNLFSKGRMELAPIPGARFIIQLNLYEMTDHFLLCL